MKLKKCRNCDTLFLKKSNRHVYCENCSQQRKRNLKKLYNQNQYIKRLNAKERNRYLKKKITIGWQKERLGCRPPNYFESNDDVNVKLEFERLLDGEFLTNEQKIKSNRGFIDETTGKIDDIIISIKRIREFEKLFRYMDKSIKLTYKQWIIRELTRLNMLTIR